MRSIQTPAMLHFSLKYSKNLALARLDLELLVLMKKCVIIDQCLWLFYSDLWQNFIDCPFQGHKQTKMKIQKKKKWLNGTWTQPHRNILPHLFVSGASLIDEQYKNTKVWSINTMSTHQIPHSNVNNLLFYSYILCL